jgi:histidine triad (HIT) family protein
MDDCLFCKIVAGEVSSTRVYEDDRVIAIMDIFPATRGHALVIPRVHAKDIHEVPQDDLAAAAAARSCSRTARRPGRRCSTTTST